MSLAAQYHAAHKERLARINARAVVEPDPQAAPVVVTFKPKPQPYPYDAGWERMWFWDLVIIKPLRQTRHQIKEIQNAVADHYGIHLHDMISARRTWDMVRPRQVAMYLSKMLTLHSFPVIGRAFGGRDHTTILHAVQQVTKRVQNDDALRDAIDEIRRRLG